VLVQLQIYYSDLLNNLNPDSVNVMPAVTTRMNPHAASWAVAINDAAGVTWSKEHLKMLLLHLPRRARQPQQHPHLLQLYPQLLWRRLPTTGHHLPTVGHHLPTMSHHLPTMDHHRPTMGHYLHLLGHRLHLLQHLMYLEQRHL
jgi:hypothetical protein